MDLGIHLVDMALWMLEYPDITRLESCCYTDGEPIETFDDEIEDYAEVMLQTGDGTSIRLACSWHLDAGRDCVIGARFYGDGGGVCLRNVDGSFYDFVAEHFEGTSSDRLAEPPDEWGGRAAVEWVARLRRSAGYDPQIESAIPVADVLDRIYGRQPGEQPDHPARTPGAGERAGIR